MWRWGYNFEVITFDYIYTFLKKKTYFKNLNVQNVLNKVRF